MAGSATNLPAPSGASGTGIGTGYFIGDGVIITAGHVMFDFNEKNLPADRHIRTMAGSSIYWDPRGYQTQYTNKMMNLANPLPTPGPNQTISSEFIEPLLTTSDIVFVTRSGSVDKDDAGLITYLTSSDITAKNFSLTASAHFRRNGTTSGTDTATSVALDSVGLRLNIPSAPGDSGGGNYIDFEGKKFIVGNTVSTNQTSFTRSTYITNSEFFTINQMLQASQSGNVTRDEPTNMIVGSSGGDSAQGTYRADIILGKGGGDTILGDPSGSGAWGNDQLFGGDANDDLTGGRGSDLLHGGDHRVYGVAVAGVTPTRTAIEDDGIDTAHYADPARTAGIEVRVGTVIASTNATSSFSANPDYARAISVQDLQYPEDIDVLISIEQIEATAKSDKLRIDKLLANQLAGSDGKGGIAKVNLGGQEAGVGDLIEGTNAVEGLNIDLAKGRVAAQNDATRFVDFTDAESVRGSGFADEIVGNEKDNDIKGGAGDDRIVGGTGADHIDGEAGVDWIVVGGGDVLAQGELVDRLFFGDFNDANALTGSRRTVQVNDSQTLQQQIATMLASPTEYKDSNGARYAVTGSGATQGLLILLADGGVVTIDRWQDGEYGINLETTKDRVTDFKAKDLGVAGYPLGSLGSVGTLATFYVNLVQFVVSIGPDPKWGAYAGDTFTLAQLQQMAGQPTLPSRSNSLEGTASADEINGRMTDDRILAWAGNDTLQGFLGNDRLDGGEGDDILVGGLGNDTVITGSGRDVVVFNRGDGADIVTGDASDIIRFGSGIAANEVHLSTGASGGPGAAYGTIGSGDITLALGTSDQIILEGAKFGSIEFADGTVRTAAQLARMAITGAATSDDDVVTGFGTDDSLAGAAGNDYLNGFAGDDTYHFGIGDGHDRIEDSAGYADRIVLGAGIDPADIIVTASKISSGPRIGEYLARLAVAGTDDWVEFVVSDIEQVQFADGTRWSSLDIGARLYGALATSGDDRIAVSSIIYGTFRPGAGDDVITAGRWGYAQIQFGLGSGVDRIELSNDGTSVGGRATVSLDPGLSFGDLQIQRSGDGFTLSIHGTDDRLEIERFYDSTVQSDWRTFDIYVSDGRISLSGTQLEQLADIDAGIVQRLYGTMGNDSYVGLASGDWLSGGAGNDVLTGNAGSDVLFGGAGDDTLSGGADSDILVGEAGDDLLDGGIGNDTLIAGPGADVLLGGTGNDQLTGSGTSTLNGGQGEDRIAAVFGDTIVYNLGDGADFVSLSSGASTLDGATSIDRTEISLGAGIDPSLTTLTLEGWAVYVNVNGSTTDRIRLDRLFQSSNLPQVRFANGTVWQEAEILGRLFNPDNGSGTANGMVSAAPDWDNRNVAYVYGGGGNDTLSDQSSPVFNAAELRYVFAPGSGNDVIPGIGRTGSLMLYGFDPDQMTIARSGNGLGDITLSFAGTSDSIKINGQQRSNGASVIYNFVFSGTTLYASQIREMWLDQVSTSGNDTITAFDGPGGGYDSGIIPGRQYTPNPGNDRLEGGLGDDVMIGGSGDDIYVINPGDGVDIVRDLSLFNAGAAAGNDKILFGAQSAGAVFSRSTVDANDLVISFIGSLDKVTVDEFYGQGAIEQFEFADGVIFSRSDVEQLAIAGSATSGADIIIGSANPETLVGGAGNDTLNGRGGSDRYEYTLGDGSDTISDTGTGESNTLALGAGIDFASIVFSRSGNDLLVRINPTDVITVIGQFGGATIPPLGQIALADGSQKSWEEIVRAMFAQAGTSGNDTITGLAFDDTVVGGAGNDVLNGGGGADILVGGTGNDFLDGGQGADIYRISRGDGVDQISSSGDGGALDTLAFDATIGSRDVEFVRTTPTSPDLVVNIRGTGQALIVSNYFDGTALATISFADGTRYTSADILDALSNAAPVATADDWRPVIGEGAASVFGIPAGLFDDDSPAEHLTYAAVLADGSPLPSWLTFDGVEFTSVANDAQVGTYSIRLIAIDQFGARIDRVFKFDVENSGEAPVATTALTTQTAAIGNGFTYTVPAGLFTDQDTFFAATPAVQAGTYATANGGSITVQSDGSYSYTPASGFSEEDQVYIPFTVGSAASIERLFQINNLGAPLTDILPSDLAPTKDSVTLTARLTNGDPLPAWLSFNGSAFSGTPGAGDAGPLAIEIVATDSTGLFTVVPFAIKVGASNLAPTAGALGTAHVAEDSPFAVAIPLEAFADADAHDRLTFMATKADGSPLPSWLSFDGRNLIGTPGNEVVGTLAINVTATDIFGVSASSTFSLIVDNINDAPVSANVIADQLAKQGEAFSFAIPAGAFADPDAGDSLSITIAQSNGLPLPGWLSYAGGILSGTPANDDTGLLRLRVTATDATGASSSQEFWVGIQDVNDAPTVVETLDALDVPVNAQTLFHIPSGLFAESDDSGYQVTVSMSDGSPLPDWIVFDPNYETLRFTPGIGEFYGRYDPEVVGVRITATDSRGGSVSTVLTATVVAPAVQNTIYGSGSNSISGTSLSDRIDSGPGNNGIYGYDGVDRIVFGRGSGQDTVGRGGYEGVYPLGDIIEFGPDVAVSDLSFSRIDDVGGTAPSGRDLLIKINGTTDQLKIFSQFGGLLNEEPTVREFVFADGTHLSASQIQAMFATTTAGDDSIRGGNQADILSGGSGNDSIYGFDGDDVIDGGAGDDKLVGDVPFRGGEGGSDTFLFGRGSGNDAVFADNFDGDYVRGSFGPQRGTDTLRFGPDITPADLIITHIPGYASDYPDFQTSPAASLLIQIAGTSDSIRLDHQFYIRYFYGEPVNMLGIERFEFADGTVMNRSQFESLITLAPTTSGNDLIAGGAGADRLVGGLGDDILVGEDGADTYVFAAGDGNDRIVETMRMGSINYGPTIGVAGTVISFDAISFGAGIRPEDIVFTRPDAAGEDLVISFKNQAGSITIEGQFRNLWHGGDFYGAYTPLGYYGQENAAIDEFRFVDGTKWSLADIYAFSVKATADDDVIDGFFRSSESLDGGAGNDLLVGRNGSDTYVFGRGYGHDTIKEFGFSYNQSSSGVSMISNDKIQFVGVASTDVTTSIGTGGAFVFRINDTGETLTIRPESNFNNFASIIFSDTTWTAAQFQTRWVVAAGTPGNDVINGFVGNDTIDGGDGDDILQGGQNSGTPSNSLGFDTLNGGNGNDTLTLESSDRDQANGDDGDDTFRIAMTLAYWSSSNSTSANPDRGRLDYPAAAVFGSESGVIDGGAGNDKLILGGKLSDYWNGYRYLSANGDGSWSFASGLRVRNVETIQFADATLAFSSIASATAPYRPGAVEGTAAGEVMNGTAGNDALYGYDGNDTLNGFDGDDFLIGGAGTDSYNGGNGTDIVEYSADPAGWTINLATGQATQSTVTESFVSIEGAYGSAASDTITGSGSADILAGGGGDDTINAGGGNDLIDFEGNVTGFDAIDGGGGTDTIRALRKDTVIGLASVTGIEAITGGGFTNVVVQGSENANTLDFSTVSLTGIAGIDGRGGNDVITGSAGADTITGGTGDDTLAGGDGDDTFSVSGTGDGFDAVSGGGGYDTIIVSSSYSRIGLTSLVGVEAISGGSGAYISGSSTANVLDFTNVVLSLITRIDGGGGNDIITGSAGNDVIQGSAGDDSLNGGLGNDVFQYTGSSSGFDLVNGGAGTNSITALANSTVIGLSGLSNVQSISAGSYTNVSIAGSSNGDTLNFMGVALSGITKIDAGAGNDVVTGTNLADTILGSGGDDNLTGADGDDVFQYSGSSNGFDTVSGGAGSDIISALAASTVIGLTALLGVETISAGGFAGVTIGGSANADTLDLSSVILTGIVSINGNAGNDVITGSAAADSILGGADNDTLSGELGDDTLNGGTGTNSLNGGDGTDVAQYSGTAGSYSVVLNGDGSYGLVGAGVNDTLVNIENLGFSDGTFTIASRVGLGLTLTGTSAAETLTGGGNNDTISGLGGDDTLNGNGGDDLFRVTGSADGFDIVDGGLGNDTITATVNNAVIGLTSLTGIEVISAGGFTGVSITGSSTANTLDFSTVTLTGITKIDGGAGNDTITGSGAADTILGSGGDDTINAGSGNDTIQFTGTSNGFDAVDGADGTDTIAALANSTVIGLRSLTGVETISAGSFTGVSIAGSVNADTLDFSTSTLTGITKIDLGAGNDTITGSAGAETILGSGGDDAINAGNGNDTIQYTGTANGFDSVDGGGGTDTISALANSTVIGLSSLVGVETISAGSFTGVYIVGSGNADTLNFSAVTLTNITRVEGGGGNDLITGNSAANTIWGGLGNDTLDAGTGNDSMLGDDGDDILKGGAGTDTINGGIGTDTLDYSAYTTNLTVNLTTTTAQTVTTGDSDTITNIENVTGGSGTDTLTGSTLANVINGGSGNDRLTGGAGNDTIIGGIGTSDVAVFAGLQASYTIATNAGVVTITDNQATTDGNDGVDTVSGIEKAEFKGGVQVGITSPIVLDLNGDGVSLLDNRATNVAYDWDSDGRADQTGWISKTDGFLVFDRNGDGLATNGSELSFTGDKEGAKSDLDGLRAFDSNNDGQFSAGDEKFNEFKIWQDRNGDGHAGFGEMLSLEEAGVASIDLGGEAVNRNWAWGENITINSGTFTRTNGTTGGFGDVALSYEVQRTAGNVLPGRGGRMPGYWNRFASIQKLAGSFADALGRFDQAPSSDLFGRRENDAHRFEEMYAPDRFLER